MLWMFSTAPMIDNILLDIEMNKNQWIGFIGYLVC